MLALNPVNAYSSAFPVLECIHIAGIVCGVGTAALVNLRLLGAGLTQRSAARLWSDATPWTVGGLMIALFSGLLLFSMDPELYYTGTLFRVKMFVLLLAIVFYFTLVRKTAATESAGRSIIAYTSLALWTLVPCCGIFLGFVGSMERAYPILLSVHIVSLVLLGGMVVLTDLRSLGIGMRSYAALDLVDNLRVLKRIAFGLAAASGLLLVSAHAGQYLSDPWFRLKIALLVLIAVNYLVFRRGAKAPRKARLAAALSLVLSSGVVLAARGPATVKDVMHSMVDPIGDFLFQSVQSIADEQGVREIAPQTGAQWENVRDRLMILQDAPNILDGRRAARLRDRSKNPEVESQPEDIQKLLDADPSAFLRRARKLQDAAFVALKAVDAKDKDALLHSLEGIDKACESCHLHYWYPNDKRAREAAQADGIVE